MSSPDQAIQALQSAIQSIEATYQVKIGVVYPDSVIDYFRAVKLTPQEQPFIIASPLPVTEAEKASNE